MDGFGFSLGFFVARFYRMNHLYFIDFPSLSFQTVCTVYCTVYTNIHAHTHSDTKKQFRWFIRSNLYSLLLSNLFTDFDFFPLLCGFPQALKVNGFEFVCCCNFKNTLAQRCKYLYMPVNKCIDRAHEQQPKF